MRRRLARALGLVVLLTAAECAADEEVAGVATRPGVTVQYLLVHPATAPVASVILLSGGAGRVGLARWKPGWTHGNFLVRSRQRFAEQGFLTAVIDAPSDRATVGLLQFRTSAAHAQDVRAVIGQLRAQTPVSVWLVGTSMGSVSAASVAERLREGGGPDGIVLTSSVTRYSRHQVESLRDVTLERIPGDVLVVHHRDDGCPSSPYDAAPSIVERLRRAARRELITVEGGAGTQGDPCEPFSPHGYLGREGDVVERIAAWIKASAR